MRAYHNKNFRQIAELSKMPQETLREMELVASVLPFKVNSYVVENLINWSDPDDPMFRLTFPQRGMLSEDHFKRVAEATEDERPEVVQEIRRELNPHSSGQVLNIPQTDEGELGGIQHKYATTVLFFPSQGQTCHAYCMYCFRWPQFVDLDNLKFTSNQIDVLLNYLRTHPEVTDVLFTGGDPMVMRTHILENYLNPLLTEEFRHINIRIGSKALAYWPQRFVTDKDADGLLRLFERVSRAGRPLAFQAHFSHEVELSTDMVREAVRRIRETGSVIRTQAPVVRHVNDSAQSWVDMLRTQTALGIVPYYMFVERDTGANNYFEVPLVRALEIYRETAMQLSGLSHTLRGPVMSSTPGKVMIEDVVEVGGERYFALKLLQARTRTEGNRLMFAKYDEEACWFDQLEMVPL